MKNTNLCPIIYRAALLHQGIVEYRRGNLAPVDYLLPWEKQHD